MTITIRDTERINMLEKWGKDKDITIAYGFGGARPWGIEVKGYHFSGETLREAIDKLINTFEEGSNNAE